MSNYLLLESGDRVTLEDETGSLILERLSSEIFKIVNAAISGIGSAIRFSGRAARATFAGRRPGAGIRKREGV